MKEAIIACRRLGPERALLEAKEFKKGIRLTLYDKYAKGKRRRLVLHNHPFWNRTWEEAEAAIKAILGINGDSLTATEFEVITLPSRNG